MFPRNFVGVLGHGGPAQPAPKVPAIHHCCVSRSRETETAPTESPRGSGGSSARMPPKAPRTQVLERYKVEREDGAPLFADCTAPGEPLRTIPLGSTVVMLEEHTPQRAGKGGGVSGDAEPWIHIVGYTPLLLPLQSCGGWVRKSRDVRADHHPVLLCALPRRARLRAHDGAWKCHEVLPRRADARAYLRPELFALPPRARVARGGRGLRVHARRCGTGGHRVS